jgi:DNA-binding MurR/RpiR family transcriptional regulator
MEEPVHSVETIAALVRRQMGDLTASERRVARSLLAAYPIAGLETLGSLAQRAGVSGPTVLRFVGKLGFDGYGEFQQVLHQEVQERLTSSLEQLERQPHEREGGILGFGLTAFVDELRSTFGSLSLTEFQAIIELLADERRPVLCTGGRFSQILAFYLTAHLNMMRPGCRHVAASPTPRFDELIDVGKRSVVVAFDYRRYQNSTIEFTRRAAERGATILLFTDPWLSPISDIARHVLTSTVTAPSPFDSFVPAMATVEVVCSGLAAHIGEAVKPRIEELERLRSGTTWGEVELSIDKRT